MRRDTLCNLSILYTDMDLETETLRRLGKVCFNEKKSDRALVHLNLMPFLPYNSPATNSLKSLHSDLFIYLAVLYPPCVFIRRGLLKSRLFCAVSLSSSMPLATPPARLQLLRLTRMILATFINRVTRLQVVSIVHAARQQTSALRLDSAWTVQASSIGVAVRT